MLMLDVGETLYCQFCVLQHYMWISDLQTSTAYVYTAALSEEGAVNLCGCGEQVVLKGSKPGMYVEQ